MFTGAYRPLLAGRPTVPLELLEDHGSETARREMEAIVRMKKIDIAELERAVAVKTEKRRTAEARKRGGHVWRRPAGRPRDGAWAAVASVVWRFTATFADATRAPSQPREARLTRASLTCPRMNVSALSRLRGS